jgi:hypothetical protein
MKPFALARDPLVVDWRDVVAVGGLRVHFATRNSCERIEQVICVLVESTHKQTGFENIATYSPLAL